MCIVHFVLRGLVLTTFLLCWSGGAYAKTVYMTFDDGPRHRTLDILNLLVEEEVPGTFFFVGEHILADETRRRSLSFIMANPWARVGNHSFSHAYHERYRAFYRDPAGMLHDFEKTNALLAFSSPPYLARLPGLNVWCFRPLEVQSAHCRSSEDGASCSEQMDEHPVRCASHRSTVPASAGILSLFERGFVIYGWDEEWMKQGEPRTLEAPSTVAARIKQRFSTGYSTQSEKVVLLIHEQHFEKRRDIEALQDLIHLLRQEGYAFDFMENY